jgi:hypothetical protein
LPGLIQLSPPASPSISESFVAKESVITVAQGK